MATLGRLKALNMSAHFFISHSKKDSAAAERLVSDLESRGVTCWMAPRDIPGGADWPAAINKAIQDCERLVLLLSGASNESEHVLREVTLAADHRKAIYPIALDDKPVSDAIRYFIANRQIEPHERAAERLTEGTVRFDKITPGGSKIRFEANGFMRSTGLSRVIALGVIAAVVAIFGLWIFRPQPAGGPSLATGVPLVAPAAPSSPPPTSPGITVSSEPVKATQAKQLPNIPLQQEPAPSSRAVIPPIHRPASIPDIASGALRPRTSLEEYAPIPEVKDTHGIVPEGSSGPLRPRINLGN